MHPVVHLEHDELLPEAIQSDGDRLHCTFLERTTLTLTAESAPHGVFLSVALDIRLVSFRSRRLGERAVLELRMTALDGTDRWMGIAPRSSWWTAPVWAARVQQLPPPVLSPCDAVAQTFRAAHDSGKITVLLRDERPLPEPFRYFGWCSWNAFYHDVSDAGMTEKLAEFREMRLLVRWVLIDDGWSPDRDERLTGFGAVPEKFPNGLREFTARAKSEFGISWVGVWHAFFGYWCGVAPDSPLADRFRAHLVETNSGFLCPGSTEDDVFAIFDAWHGALEQEGIDFVKIDGQGSLKDFLHGERPAVPAAAVMHRGIERSVARHFDNRVINCMGVTQENMFARPQTALTRNSDDFFPDLPDSFRAHLMQNAYTGVFQRNLYACDWDMWWSSHHSAVRSAVQRAVSGDLVYVSDKIGATDAAQIRPLIEDDGRVLMGDERGTACSAAPRTAAR